MPKNKSKPNYIHSGGVVVVIHEIPEESTWADVKAELTARLQEGAEEAKVWYVSHVNDKRACAVVTAPFPDDLAFYERLQLFVGGELLRCEIAYGEELRKALAQMPKNIRDKREKHARQAAKQRNRPIAIAGVRFTNIGDLRGRAKKILNSCGDQPLDPSSPDFRLISALLAYHPRAPEKGKGLTGLRVGPTRQGESRCFWIQKEGIEDDDLSIKKCLDALSENPPYVIDGEECLDALRKSPLDAVDVEAPSRSGSPENRDRSRSPRGRAARASGRPRPSMAPGLER